MTFASADDLRRGFDAVRAASDMSGIPVVYTTGRSDILAEFMADGRDAKYIGTPLVLVTYMKRDVDSFAAGSSMRGPFGAAGRGV